MVPGMDSSDEISVIKNLIKIWLFNSITRLKVDERNIWVKIDQDIFQLFLLRQKEKLDVEVQKSHE